MQTTTSLPILYSPTNLYLNMFEAFLSIHDEGGAGAESSITDERYCQKKKQKKTGTDIL